MRYEVLIEKKAERQLARIADPEYSRIKQAISQLADTPRPPSSKKLKGRDALRIRVGDYRVIYQVKDKQLLVLVVEVGHRREVYR
jgi:mRNA interferase RelE/StbE